MKHLRLDELWLELSEGTLPAEEARPLRSHLEECAECGPEYRRLEAVHRASVRAGSGGVGLGTGGPPRAMLNAIHASVLEAGTFSDSSVRIVPGVEGVAGSLRSQARVPRGAPLVLRERRFRFPASVAGFVAVAAGVTILVCVLMLRLINARAPSLEPTATGTRSAAVPDGGRRMARALGALLLHRRSPGVEFVVQQIRERWDANELHLKSFSLSCATGAQTIDALVDDAGKLAALLRQERSELADIDLFVGDGSPVPNASVRLDLEWAARQLRRGRSEVDAEPPPQRFRLAVTQEQARALVAAPTCVPGTPR